MKLLFDENLSFRLCQELSQLFPQSGQVRSVGLEKASDAAIWEFAAKNGFVLVSLDADFAEMAAVRGPPPKVIWLRCGNRSTADIAAILRKHAGTVLAFEREPVACLEIY